MVEEQEKTQNNVEFDLNYRLILTTQRRMKMIDEVVSKHLRLIFLSTQVNFRIRLKNWANNADYVLIDFSAHPKSELSRFINAYKSVSNKMVQEEFSTIAEELRGDYFWDRSFCLVTLGDPVMETVLVTQYLENHKQ